MGRIIGRAFGLGALPANGIVRSYRWCDRIAWIDQGADAENKRLASADGGLLYPGHSRRTPGGRHAIGQIALPVDHVSPWEYFRCIYIRVCRIFRPS